MPVQIPPVLVLIVCKTMAAGVPDPNAAYTNAENLQWATEHSMMVCRRNEVQLYDPAEGMQLKPADAPAPALSANLADPGQCARAGMPLATQWNLTHRGTPWRVWKVGCPAPIVDLRTGGVIGYKLPECGHRDTVICEVDSEI
jgi:hypothetical protein